MIRIRELPRPHFVGVRLQCIDGDLRELRVALRELGLELVEDAEEIVAQQELATAGRTRADPEREDLDRVIHGLGHRGGDRLDLEPTSAGRLDRQPVFDDTHGFICRLPLQLEAAIQMHEMGAHTDMTHDRHAGIGDGLDDGRLLVPALHLDDVGTALFHDAKRVEDADLLRRIAAVGHGDEHHAVGCSSADCLAMLDHHVDGDWQCVGMAVVCHPKRVTHGSDVNARPLRPYGRRVVRDRDHHDLLVGLLAGLEVGHRQALAFFGHARSPPCGCQARKACLSVPE